MWEKVLARYERGKEQEKDKEDRLVESCRIFFLSDTAFFTTDLSNIERMSKSQQKCLSPISKTHVRQCVQ